MGDLSVHDVAHPLDCRAQIVGQPQDFQRVADGSQRVPQLVGEHRQELILATVGFAELLVQSRVLDEVHRLSRAQVDKMGLAVDRSMTAAKVRREHADDPARTRDERRAVNCTKARAAGRFAKFVEDRVGFHVLDDHAGVRDSRFRPPCTPVGWTPPAPKMPRQNQRSRRRRVRSARDCTATTGPCPRLRARSPCAVSRRGWAATPALSRGCTLISCSRRRSPS